MSNRKIDYEMADYFRSIVDKSGLSQEEWATRLGVTPRSVAYYWLRPKNAVGQKTFAVSKNCRESLKKNSVPTGEQAHRDAVF